MLGLTLQCAQCHTHKFDPIQHTDYYGLFAFLNNSAEGSATVYTPKQQEQRRNVLDGVRSIEDELNKQHPDWPQRLATWERESQSAPQPLWNRSNSIPTIPPPAGRSSCRNRMDPTSRRAIRPRRPIQSSRCKTRSRGSPRSDWKRWWIPIFRMAAQEDRSLASSR